MKALKRNNDGVTHASIDMLCALMCVSIKLQFFQFGMCELLPHRNQIGSAL